MQRTGRKPRIHQPNTIHHVMIRGNNRQIIFYDDDCFVNFLNFIKESTEKFDHKILGYCLMTNHVHLIVRINQNALSAIMQNINFRYSCWLNRKMRRIGHLFQGRFRSIEVCDQEYLVNLCYYVHYNPVVAGMVNRVDQYRWSSHQYYAFNTSTIPKWLDLDIINKAILNITNLNYERFISQSCDREKWNPSFYRSETGEFIFEDGIQKNENSALEDEDKIFLPIDSVVDIVCGCLLSNRDEIFSASRKREISKRRSLVIIFILKHCAVKMSEISVLFNRTQACLSRQVKSLSASVETYFSKNILQKIDRRIREYLDEFSKVK